MALHNYLVPIVLAKEIEFIFNQSWAKLVTTSQVTADCFEMMAGAPQKRTLRKNQRNWVEGGIKKASLFFFQQWFCLCVKYNYINKSKARDNVFWKKILFIPISPTSCCIDTCMTWWVLTYNIDSSSCIIRQGGWSMGFTRWPQDMVVQCIYPLGNIAVNLLQ